MLKTFSLYLTIFLMSNFVFAQKKDTAITKKDTVKTSKSIVSENKKQTIKPYKQVITEKAVSMHGVFSIHKLDENYYLEIPEKIFKKEFLVVNRLTKAAAGMRNGTSGYAGDQIGQQIISFEKGKENNIFIRSISYVDYSKDSTASMYQSVVRNNIQSITKSFDIKAIGLQKDSYVIDFSEFIKSDNELIAFSPYFKENYHVGSYQKDLSFVNFVKAFPNNLEINTTKTFSKANGKKDPNDKSQDKITGNYTVEINSSFVLLPENKMQSRYFDPRVGYFTVGYTDFDADPQGVKKVSLIKKWRLEPKPSDIEKYKKGELVEPSKPIVFYIDPATPKKWIPYLIQGVNDWQIAFEKAGFKNAIYAKIPDPILDKDWSLEDARFSAIVYKPSDVANASGPSIADPRTGEILESHINWYHNVMQLLRNWYFIQAAPNDPRARKMKFDDELMGQLIRFVSSHEVGHTLGLRHNFGSSSTVPVEKLRDKKWVEENGHTPSIMDYARFNYVAQPEDHIGDLGIMPRIGDYDFWAIEWGYRNFYEFNTPEKEKSFLNQWVIKKLKNNRLWFGTESNPLDPRSQSEQIGDNPMKAGEYGIKNLKMIIQNLEKWTQTNDEGYENLDLMYKQVTDQFKRYLGHAAKYIGGTMETPKTSEQTGAIYEIVKKEDQKEALAFLNQEIFKTPKWLIDEKIFEKTGKTPDKTIEDIQKTVFNRILSPLVLQNMSKMESLDKNAYSVLELYTDLNAMIFSHPSPDLYQRNLQRMYIENQIQLLKNNSLSEILAITRGNLRNLEQKISEMKPSEDLTNKYHLEDLEYQIKKILTIHNEK